MSGAQLASCYDPFTSVPTYRPFSLGYWFSGMGAGIGGGLIDVKSSFYYINPTLD